MNNPKFSKQYQTFMNKAAALAAGEGTALIGRRHLLTALARQSPGLLNRLLGCREVIFAESPPATGPCRADVGVPSFSQEAYRVLSMAGGILGHVMEKTNGELVDLPHVAAALLLDQSPDSPVREILHANGLAVDTNQVMDALRRLEGGNAKGASGCLETYRAVSAIRKRLLEDVIGQEKAISSLCDSLLRHWLRPRQERRTPLVFTVLGRSGSGKTHIANVFSQALARSSNGDVTYLNGGNFATDNTAHDFVGYDASWRGGARSGLFTYPAINNPHAVIVIENVELLHPIARSHLMKALTTGSIKDDKAGREISFQDATVLLLTSAGCEELDSGGAHAGRTRSRLIEELCTRIDNENRRENIAALAGASMDVILMRNLTIRELRQLFVRRIEEEIESIRRTIAPRVTVDVERLADTLLEGIDSANPSQILPLVRTYVADPLYGRVLETSGRRTRVRSVVINLESESGTACAETVAANLAMLKRRRITAEARVERAKIVLDVRSGDYILLPAVRDGIIKVEPPPAGDSFERLVGMETAIAYARRWVAFFDGTNPVRPDGILLVGDPGTGKTSFVRSLAAEIKRPYAVLNCSELSSAETITRTFAAFRRYGKDGIIVFLDELDAVAGDRNDNKSSAYIERLNLLLENIDGIANDPSSKILYIGATNRIEALDKAVIRDGRLGRALNFRSPNGDARRRLLEMELSESRIMPPPDPSLIEFMVHTTEDMTGAMIKAVVREFAMSVAESSPPTRETYARARQLVLQGESTNVEKLDDKLLLNIAVHEAGHAVLCDAIGRSFIQATIVDDAGSSRQGFVESADNTLCSGPEILGSIDIVLAGRAAQEVLGFPPSGAECDLKTATKLAFTYIQNGFSPECGLLYLEDADARMKDVARRLLDEGYERACTVLRRDRNLLEACARLLVRRRTIFHDDFIKLKGKTSKTEDRHEI